MAKNTTPATPSGTADYFRATGAELRAASEAGDEQATAELARRKAKRGANAAAKATGNVTVLPDQVAGENVARVVAAPPRRAKGSRARSLANAVKVA